MKPEDLLGLLIPVVYVLLLIVESLAQARRFPRVPWWPAIGAGFVVILLSLNVVIPLVLPLDWVARHRLLPGDRLGVVGGTLIGYLVLSLVNFAWHRAEHRFGCLWRWFHQLHHSPQRVDISGSAYTHPQEVVVMVLLSLGVTVLVLGLDPVAAALTGFVGAFFSMFQHWNVRTPRWLGWLIQRPEAHCYHHEFEVHGRNYSDLPLWDIVFGSFYNPSDFSGRVGFKDGADRRVGAMLIGRDVNR